MSAPLPLVLEEEKADKNQKQPSRKKALGAEKMTTNWIAPSGLLQCWHGLGGGRTPATIDSPLMKHHGENVEGSSKITSERGSKGKTVCVETALKPWLPPQL